MKKKEIKFSFVVPVYNAEKHLGACIEAILRSAKNAASGIEIILINDGSTDDSLKILRDFEAAHDSIIVISKKNTGVSPTRNLGLERATGEYICFVDSDDHLTEDYVLKLENTLKYCVADVLQIGFERRIGDRILYQVAPTRSKQYNDLNRYFSVENYTHAVWSYVFKRGIIETYQIRFDEQLRYSEDQDFILKFFTRTANMVTISSVLYLYNDVPTSAVNSSAQNKEKGRNRALAQLVVVENLFKQKVNLQAYHKEVINDLVDDYFVYAARVDGYTQDEIMVDYTYFVEHLQSSYALKEVLLKNLKRPQQNPSMYLEKIKSKINWKKKTRKVQKMVRGLVGTLSSKY
ncbi:glycosyltransferase family 2 protein [Sphingobacterium corticibacter]|uniref:Glycosyltransferase 2-like domain-containing protein n=1 Tax=Sphingobacterium corticibacter TaxID=2171749 RepID=A0A2T8HJF6_9SPHI|nr:glycosyltransferase [Sphingobacterium corticibacter]PVH25586.1 hypothetical protein DC487_06490 [Sphingobacterium corticibacter]